jgi:hypothetical protein
VHEVGLELADAAAQAEDVRRQSCERPEVNRGQPHGLSAQVANARRERYHLDGDALVAQPVEQRAFLSQQHRDVHVLRQLWKQPQEGDLPARKACDVVDEDDAQPAIARRRQTLQLSGHAAQANRSDGAARGTISER